MQIKTNKHHLAKIIKGHTIGFQTLLTHVFFDNISIIYLSGEFLPQIEVADEAIYPIIMFLKKHTLCLYEIMIDSTAYELLSHIYRFILSFNLLSLKYNTRILIKSKVKELNTNILSLTSIFFNSF
jgi:hypothetical protein